MIKKLFFRVLVFLETCLKRTSNNKPFIYVAIGDSTIEGVGATAVEKSFASLVYSFLKKHKPKVAFYNFGKIHSRIQDVIDYQLPLAIEKNPDLIVLSVGANDIRFQTKPKNFYRSLDYLIGLIKEKTHAQIVINTIPDLSLLSIFPYYIRIYCKWMVSSLNKKITSYMQQDVIVVDVFAQSKRIKWDKDFLSADGIHPSDIGYAFWANRIIDEIARVFFPGVRQYS